MPRITAAVVTSPPMLATAQTPAASAASWQARNAFAPSFPSVAGRNSTTASSAPPVATAAASATKRSTGTDQDKGIPAPSSPAGSGFGAPPAASRATTITTMPTATIPAASSPAGTPRDRSPTGFTIRGRAAADDDDGQGDDDQHDQAHRDDRDRVRAAVAAVGGVPAGWVAG